MRTLLAEPFASLWDIDFTSLNETEAIVRGVFELTARLREIYADTAKNINGASSERVRTEALIIKILLVTLACALAYDNFVVMGMRNINEFPATFRPTGYLGCIDFLCRNLPAFNEVQTEIATVGPKYLPMKLIDMYFWSIGNQLGSVEEKE